MDEKNLKLGSGVVTVIIIAVILITTFGRYLIPTIDKSWVIDAACTEVKSQVYRDYGKIPTISGNLVYHDGTDFIVVVKYKIPEFKWEASRACHIFGYEESNWFLSGMTNELPYDYKYIIEELKALWAIS